MNLEMGPTIRALVPQGRGQADLALLYIPGALDWLVLNMTQKMNWEAVTIRRGTGSGSQETALMSSGPTKSYFKLERGEQQ